MSGCGSGCNCGSNCSCGSDCKCGRQADLSAEKITTATIIAGVAPVKTFSEISLGAENDGCGCGNGCQCDPCTCK